MLSSKEALEKIVDDISLEWGYEGIGDELREKLKPLYEDLDRLEKLEKVIEILKDKKVNMFHIWVFDDYTQYKQHYPFSEYNAEGDMLTNKEFDLLKEWLENDK